MLLHYSDWLSLNLDVVGEIVGVNEVVRWRCAVKQLNDQPRRRRVLAKDSADATVVLCTVAT